MRIYTIRALRASNAELRSNHHQNHYHGIFANHMKCDSECLSHQTDITLSIEDKWKTDVDRVRKSKMAD